MINEANGKKWTTITGVVNLAMVNHEQNIIEWIRQNIHRTDLFLDVGANVGVLSIHLSDHFKNVVAIEPQRVNLFALRNNIKINGVENIEVVESAVWGENTKIFLEEYSHSDFSGTSRTSNKSNSGALRSVEVDAITVDSLHLDPSFVKIDIEGAEKECLKGMTETIKRCKPIILVEIHKCYGVDFNDIVNYLAEQGYSGRELSRTSDVYFYIFE